MLPTTEKTTPLNPKYLFSHRVEPKIWDATEALVTTSGQWLFCGRVKFLVELIREKDLVHECVKVVFV